MCAESPKETKIKQQNPKKIQINGKTYGIKKFLKSTELKTIFVNENPYEAQQFYYLSRNKELGKIFALKYNGHPEYGGSAYHIGQELGLLCIEEPKNSVKDIANSVKEDAFDTNDWVRKIMDKKDNK